MESRIVVLIASHITTPQRRDTLIWAIRSIIKNTKLPDCIYISMSGTDEGKGNIVETLYSKYSKYTNINILEQPEQKLQFEHYQILKDHVRDDDIICFLDDDDFYHPEKLERVYKEMNGKYTTEPELVIKHPFAIFYEYMLELSIKTVEDAMKQIKGDVYCGEYCCKSMFGITFKNWFEHPEVWLPDTQFGIVKLQPFDIFLKTCRTADLIFTASFPKSKIFSSDTPLLYYRKWVYALGKYKNVKTLDAPPHLIKSDDTGQCNLSINTNILNAVINSGVSYSK